MSEQLRVLSMALLHFVWEGAAIALIAFCILPLARTSSSRYGLLCLALLAMPVAFGLTVWRLAAPEVSAQSVATASTDLPWMQWIATAWLAGVSLGAVRLLLAWLRTERLRRGAVAPEWLAATVQDLANRLGLRRPVEVRCSDVGSSPATIGWLRAVVVLPVSVLTRLSPSQLECVLLHELAHIRRHDYLVNLIQCLVEVVFFYNPAAWLVSSRIRLERENCCDDIAAQAVADPIAVARALEALGHLRLERGVLAVAASGPGLPGRIRRLIDATDRAAPPRPALALAIVVPALATMLVLSAPKAAARTPLPTSELVGGLLQHLAVSVSGDAHDAYQRAMAMTSKKPDLAVRKPPRRDKPSHANRPPASTADKKSDPGQNAQKPNAAGSLPSNSGEPEVTATQTPAPMTPGAPTPPGASQSLSRGQSGGSVDHKLTLSAHRSAARLLTSDVAPRRLSLLLGSPRQAR